MTEKDRCCLACGRFLEGDISHCPYCGEALGKKGKDEGREEGLRPSRHPKKWATPLSIKWKYARRRIWADRIIIFIGFAIIAGILYAYFSKILPEEYLPASMLVAALAGLGVFVTIMDYVWAAHDMMDIEIEMAGKEER